MGKSANNHFVMFACACEFHPGWSTEASIGLLKEKGCRNVGALRYSQEVGMKRNANLITPSLHDQCFKGPFSRSVSEWDLKVDVIRADRRSRGEFNMQQTYTCVLEAAAGLNAVDRKIEQNGKKKKKKNPPLCTCNNFCEEK